jgi:hypothetical protein
MAVTEALLRAQNAQAQIPMADMRAAELPVELNQLAAAAEAVRHLQIFDSEPADFVRVLHALAWTE